MNYLLNTSTGFETAVNEAMAQYRKGRVQFQVEIVSFES